jgi:hypothetical protein
MDPTNYSYNYNYMDDTTLTYIIQAIKEAATNPTHTSRAPNKNFLCFSPGCDKHGLFVFIEPDSALQLLLQSLILPCCAFQLKLQSFILPC